MSQQSLIANLGEFELIRGNFEQHGASMGNGGCNFVIYAPDAEEVFLCLFDKDENPLAQIALLQRLQSKWCGFIKGVNQNHLYAYRLRPKKGRRVHPESSVQKLLIDPYAKALNRPLSFDSKEYRGDSHHMIPKALILSSAASNNKERNKSESLRPMSIPPETRVIYEAHVKGMTALHPDVPEEHRGKYLGASHPSVIKHLLSLGITSVQFLPLMSFMPEPFITQKGLTNYWGYNPINFFAPEPRYANKDAVSECKAMIQAYRDANIEVILDVVFNHTCEAGDDGPVISFRGFCESHAYLMDYNDESDTFQYVNYSGCGNTVKVSDHYIMNLLLDALRYWVTEMGVSGFRFDLASVVGREVFEFKNTATFFKVLKQDPVLKNALMLAEPWDIGPGGYQLGHYPDYWLEVNDKFRDVVRGFWRGDKGLKGEFATRLMGSRDIFRKTLRPMHASVNNVSYHDGFTLHDIVSYEQKHNDANLEDNRDGHNHNLSANYGEEGVTTKPEILAIREQQKRNLFATLLLSQGTPHILGGDELSKTQHGNNNAYCQDNGINYYHWDLSADQEKFLNYCRYVVKLRANNPVLQQMNFADDLFDNKQNILSAVWYRRDGSHKSDIDWVNHEHHCFALHIFAEVELDDELVKQDWLFCINSLDKEREFTVSILQSDTQQWKLMLDTALTTSKNYHEQVIQAVFNMPARSIRVYKKQ